MTDQISDQFSDQDRRAMHDWANLAVADSGRQEREPWVTAARFILATVEPPAPTLAEEIEEWTITRLDEEPSYEELVDIRQDLYHFASRISSMERDLTEARAEAERLKATAAERENGAADQCLERNPETKARVESALKNIDKTELVHTAAIRCSEDVVDGEVWSVVIGTGADGEAAIGTRHRDRDVPWTVIFDAGVIGRALDDEIILISRLTPEPRVITDTEGLNKLPAGSVVIDQIGRAWQRNHNGWFSGSYFGWPAADVIKSGPVAVLWKPEETK